MSKPPKAFVAFNALKRDIMLGTLSAGTSLTELELAAHFQCSQGTVREALLQLQEEGLVLRQGHRGTQVSECTADEAVAGSTASSFVVPLRAYCACCDDI